MSHIEAFETIWYLTLVKILLGGALGIILIGSLYKFKTIIMTGFGALMLSNLVILYLVMGFIEWN